MKKEVENHFVHLSRTFERLITTLFPEDEFDLITSADRESAILMLTTRKSWIKVADLVEPGVNTEKMVLIHLLHLQSIGRVIVDDVDPRSGAQRIDKVAEEGEGAFSTYGSCAKWRG